MSTKPVHAPMTAFAVADGVLQIGGMALTRLAERVGRTPFYAYERAALNARVAHVRAHLPEGVGLNYSMKANPMPALVQHMAPLVDGIDVASSGELQVALNAGMDPRHISFAGPGKTPAELRQAVAAGVCVFAESELEIDRLAAAGDALGIAPRVLLRVNPDFELKSSGMRMGGGAKPFGIDAERIPACLAQLAALGLDCLGLHIFSGSQSLKAEAIIEAHNKSVELALHLAPLAMLNIGGAFGIPYFPGEVALDLAPVGANLQRLQGLLPKETRLSLELGRYLVGEAGVYVSRVVDRKLSRGEVFLITDGGLHHHLAASGNFGQVIRKNYPVAIGNRMAEPASEVCTVSGPLCTPLDVLAERMALPPAQVGDLVVVFQSGAYGMSASPQGFLGHPQAAEVLL